METLIVTRIVHAEPNVVWPLLADVTLVADWHPSVQTVDLLSPSPTGLGAARRCNFYDGTSVREVVTELSEGKSVTVELSEFSLPMKHFEAQVSLSPAGGGTTQVTFEMRYEVKFGILGKAMNFLMVRGQMSKLLNTVLAGLDHHAATGDRIGQDFAPRKAA